MKSIKNMILAFLILSYIPACHKSSECPLPVKPADISGKWKWIYTRYPGPLTDTNPLTPQNSGMNEILNFNPDNSWWKTINSIIVDSGTFTLGHGIYTPYSGAYTFEYDSILYYRNGKEFDNGTDYYLIRDDTLFFGPYLAARFFSYTLPYNGEKCWIRQY